MVQVGQRIEMVSMFEDPDPILAGERGTVTGIYTFCIDTKQTQQTQLAVDWDNGRTLAVILPIDKIKLID